MPHVMLHVISTWLSRFAALASSSRMRGSSCDAIRMIGKRERSSAHSSCTSYRAGCIVFPRGDQSRYRHQRGSLLATACPADGGDIERQLEPDQQQCA